MIALDQFVLIDHARIEMNLQRADARRQVEHALDLLLGDLVPFMTFIKA